MADLSDLENAIVAQVALALFPAAYLPGALAASNTGVSVKLYRGWPEQTQLMQDLQAGNAHVSVFAEPNATRNTTRYLRVWQQENSPATPTLTATVSGSTVTFGGTGGAGQVAGVQFGPGVAPKAFGFRLGATDTPNTVAAAFAALISGASAAGAVLTLPLTPVIAEVGADTKAILETRREIQVERVSVWASNPSARDALCSLIDSQLTLVRNLQFPDGSVSNVFGYRGTYQNDYPARDRIWRRDLCYDVEYPTTVTMTVPAMLFGTPVLTASGQTLILGPFEPGVTGTLP